MGEHYSCFTTESKPPIHQLTGTFCIFATSAFPGAKIEFRIGGDVGHYEM